MMSLNYYRDESGDFMERINASDGCTEDKIKMLDEEYKLFKESINNPEKLRHQIYDMVFILFEIAFDYGFDIEAEWIKGKEKKQKKYIENSYIE